MHCVGESLLYAKFEGITKYKLGDQELERSTHWCFSLDEVFQALENQKKRFEKNGAKIISQRAQRRATFELKLKS